MHIYISNLMVYSFRVQPQARCEQLCAGSRTHSWWRHQMEAFSASLTLCEGKSTNHRLITLTKGQWRGALMFSLISAWTNGLANNRYTSDLRRHRSLWRHSNIKWPLNIARLAANLNPHIGNNRLSTNSPATVLTKLQVRMACPKGWRRFERMKGSVHGSDYHYIFMAFPLGVEKQTRREHLCAGSRGVFQ